MNTQRFHKAINQMLKKCYCINTKKGEAGFKLQKVRYWYSIISVVNTVQALLIFEQLYGNNFIYLRELKDLFDFDKIKKFLLNKCKEFCNMDEKNIHQLK